MIEKIVVTKPRMWTMEDTMKKMKADKRARWEARCPVLVKTLSALKRLVLRRKKPTPKKKPVTTPIPS